MDLANVVDIMGAVLALAFVLAPFFGIGFLIRRMIKMEAQFRASLTKEDLAKIASSRIVGNGLVGWQNEALVSIKQAWLLSRK